MNKTCYLVYLSVISNRPNAPRFLICPFPALKKEFKRSLLTFLERKIVQKSHHEIIDSISTHLAALLIR